MEREGLTEVTVEEYLSFDDIETNEQVINNTVWLAQNNAKEMYPRSK